MPSPASVTSRAVTRLLRDRDHDRDGQVELAGHQQHRDRDRRRCPAAQRCRARGDAAGAEQSGCLQGEEDADGHDPQQRADARPGQQAVRAAGGRSTGAPAAPAGRRPRAARCSSAARPARGGRTAGRRQRGLLGARRAPSVHARPWSGAAAGHVLLRGGAASAPGRRRTRSTWSPRGRTGRRPGSTCAGSQAICRARPVARCTGRSGWVTTATESRSTAVQSGRTSIRVIGPSATRVSSQ